MWECKKIIQTHHFKCGAVSARRVLDIADKSTIRKFQMLQNDGNREVLRSLQRFSYQEKLGNSKQEQ